MTLTKSAPVSYSSSFQTLLNRVKLHQVIINFKSIASNPSPKSIQPFKFKINRIKPTVLSAARNGSGVAKTFRDSLIKKSEPVLLTSKGYVLKKIPYQLTTSGLAWWAGLKWHGPITCYTCGNPIPLIGTTICPSTTSAVTADDGIDHPFSDDINQMLLADNNPQANRSFAFPFVTETPNITFCLPAYLVFVQPDGYQSIQADPVAVEVQSLVLDAGGSSIPDSKDPSGLEWQQYPGSSIAVSPGAGGLPINYAINTFGDLWEVNLGFNSVSTSPFAFLEGNATSQPANNLLNLSINLTNVATVVRFVISDCSKGNNCSDPASASPILTTSPIVLVDEPTAFAQLKVQPLFIVYAPPGTQSSCSYQLGQSIVSSFTLGASSTSSQTDTQVTQSSIGFTASAGGGGQDPNSVDPSGGGGGNPDSFPLSPGFNFSTSNGWDNSTQTVSSSTLTNGNSIQFATSSTQQISTQPVTLDSSHQAPFWNDQYFLLVHPQYVLWNLLNPTEGQTSYIQYNLIAASDTTVQISVYTLDQCAQGNCEQASFATNGSTETLTPQDCQQLLTLDPFYVNGQHFLTNNAPPNNTSPVGSWVKTLTVGLGSKENYSALKTSVTGYSGSYATTLTSSITSSTGVTTSLGFSVGSSSSLKLGINGTISNSTTNSTTNSNANSQGVSINLSATQQAAVSLIPSPGFPIFTKIFTNNSYGTLMFPASPPAVTGLCPSATPYATGCQSISSTSMAASVTWAQGSQEYIVGSGFTDTQSVLFGSQPATFLVNSDDLISVTVPTVNPAATAPFQSELFIAGLGFQTLDVGPLFLQ